MNVEATVHCPDLARDIAARASVLVCAGHPRICRSLLRAVFVLVQEALELEMGAHHALQSLVATIRDNLVYSEIEVELTLDAAR